MKLIHSVDYIRLKKEGKAHDNFDGTVTVLGHIMRVDDRCYTREFEK